MPYPDTFEGFSVASHEKWSDFKRTEVRHIITLLVNETGKLIRLSLLFSHIYVLSASSILSANSQDVR